MATGKDDLKSRELRVVSSNPSRNKEGSGWKLRVVEYYKAGKSISIKLESGEYFLGDDQVTRFKAKGLSLRDLEELEKIDAVTGKPIYLTVKALMKSPPPLPEEGEPEPQANAAPDPDAVPFS